LGTDYTDETWQTWATNIRETTQTYLNGNKQTDESIAPASFLRLAFHDAITGTPNASIRYELHWSENRALSRPWSVVERIYNDVLESSLPSTEVGSYADCIALVATQALEYTGGPRIPIRLGRRDVEHADPYWLETPIQGDTARSVVTRRMPDAGLDSDGLRLYFGRLGLSEAEFVALSGLHGIGRHVSLLGMNQTCLRNLTRTCLEEAPVLLPFVTASTNRFSNAYFEALLRWNAQQVTLGEVSFIPTDVALVVDTGLRRYVKLFAASDFLYRRALVHGWQRLLESTATTRNMY
jgi:hypothetical protein